jgi:hypothetical protein
MTLKHRLLTEEEIDSITFSLECVADVETPVTNDLLTWIDGLKLGLGFHGVNAEQDPALDEIYEIEKLGRVFEGFWVDSAMALSRFSTNPTDWAEAVQCLEGGPHDEWVALEFAAKSLASRFLDTPRDISLGLYAVSLLFQKDRLMRGLYLDLADDIRLKLGPSLRTRHDRLFGPWLEYDLITVLDHVGLSQFSRRLDDIRDEVDVAAIRALSAFHLWQVWQLARAEHALPPEAGHVLRYSMHLAETYKDNPELLPLDFEKSVNHLIKSTSAKKLPFIPWASAYVPMMKVEPIQLSPIASPSVSAACHFMNLAQTIYNSLVDVNTARGENNSVETYG